MKIEICDEFYYRINAENEDIYKKFNTSKENVLRNNDKIKLYNGEWVKIKLNDYVSHHVKPMETIKSIAETYNVDTAKILKDNDLKTEKLFIGQRLKIYKNKIK